MKWIPRKMEKLSPSFSHTFPFVSSSWVLHVMAFTQAGSRCFFFLAMALIHLMVHTPCVYVYKCVCLPKKYTNNVEHKRRKKKYVKSMQNMFCIVIKTYYSVYFFSYLCVFRLLVVFEKKSMKKNRSSYHRLLEFTMANSLLLFDNVVHNEKWEPTAAAPRKKPQTTFE